MRVVIDTKQCKEKGLEYEELIAMLLVKSGVSIPDLFNSMCKKELIVADSLFNTYRVTQRWNDVLADTLLSAESYMPKEDAMINLAKSMMELFPSGKKDGTNSYWKGNTKDTVLKLKKFFKLYSNKYTDEQILKATKQYVDSFNGDYSIMRILKYFILKEVRKVNSEGVGYVEEISDLATFLENMDQEDFSNNWNVELK